MLVGEYAGLPVSLRTFAQSPTRKPLPSRFVKRDAAVGRLQGGIVGVLLVGQHWFCSWATGFGKKTVPEPVEPVARGLVAEVAGASASATTAHKTSEAVNRRRIGGLSE